MVFKRHALSSLLAGEILETNGENPKEDGTPGGIGTCAASSAASEHSDRKAAPLLPVQPDNNGLSA